MCLILSNIILIEVPELNAQDLTRDSIMTTDSTYDDIVITGHLTHQTLSQSVYKVHVITKEKIQQKAPTHIQQILNTELGIKFSNDMALGVSDINYMGMSGRNIKILVDGVPILDRGEIRESLNQIDVSQIERIEIVEGPMSVMYGTDALAGVINIITVKSKSNHNGGLSIKLHAETVGKEYDFFNQQGLYQASINGFYKWEKMSLHGGLSHYNFNGFNGDEYNRNHSWKPKHQLMPHLKIGYDGGLHQIYYKTDYLNENIYAKAPINFDNYKATTQVFHTQRSSHQVQSNLKINEKISLFHTGQFTYFTRATQTTIKDLVTGSTQLSSAAGTQDRDKFIAAQLRSHMTYKWSEDLSFITGVEYNYDQAEGNRISGFPSQSTWSLFVTPEYQIIHNLKLRPGLRWVYNSHYAAPPLIPSINIYYTTPQNYIYRLSYAQGFRAPSLRELHFNFVDANHHLSGNTQLKAENSKSFVGSITRGYWIHSTYWTAELNGFYNQYNNLITFAAHPHNPNEFINVNIEKYKVVGAGLKQKMNYKNLNAHLGFLIMGQYNQLSSVSDDIKELSWTPELNVELNYLWEKTHTQFSLFYKFTGQRQAYQGTFNDKDDLIISQTHSQSYSDADFSLRQKISPQFFISIGARNLFNIYNLTNTGVSSGVHTSSSMAFGYGRSFFLTVQYNL